MHGLWCQKGGGAGYQVIEALSQHALCLVTSEIIGTVMLIGIRIRVISDNNN